MDYAASKQDYTREIIQQLKGEKGEVNIYGKKWRELYNGLSEGSSVRRLGVSFHVVFSGKSLSAPWTDKVLWTVGIMREDMFLHVIGAIAGMRADRTFVDARRTAP